jgi:rRNA maturation protein Nop10
MSERILRILLEELKTLRLVCRSCGDAVELAIDKLDTPLTRDAYCPGCGGPLRSIHPHTTAPDVFDKLALAIRGLQQLRSHEAQLAAC